MDWFAEIAERLRDYSEGDVWGTGVVGISVMQKNL